MTAREHVLWIGGGQGSGKSSIAWALSRRFDLQLYVVDHRMYAHLPRMAASEFESLSLDERWVHPSPQRMVKWFVETSRDRFRLVLDDLATAPPAPMVLVEGPQLFPSFLAPLLPARDQALFLLPDPAEQRERLLARGPMAATSNPERARSNAIERNVLISSRIEDEANAFHLPVQRVDRSLDAMVDLAAAVFAPALAGGPRGGDLAAARRRENEVMATQVRLYRASGKAPPANREMPLPFACECGTSGCHATVELPLEVYGPERRVLAH